MILNPCTCGGEPYWAESVKMWRCNFCNKAGYAGDKEGRGWNAINSQPATGELSKFKLPNRQEQT